MVSLDIIQTASLDKSAIRSAIPDEVIKEVRAHYKKIMKLNINAKMDYERNASAWEMIGLVHTMSILGLRAEIEWDGRTFVKQYDWDR